MQPLWLHLDAANRAAAETVSPLQVALLGDPTYQAGCGQMTIAVCPPHHWLIDARNHGICRKCGAERQWPRHPNLLHGNSWPHSKQPPSRRGMSIDEDRFPEISHYED